MLHQTIKRILAFTMACALLLGGVQALADQVYVRGSVAVYDQPDESAQTLGTLKAGTEVKLVAEKGGWAMIEKGGYRGYMKVAGLITVVSVGRITAYTAEATPMYKSFSTDSARLGTIPAGEAVTVAAKAEDMAYVKYGSHTGFVAASSLTADAPAREGAVEEPVAEPVRMTVYAAHDGAKVYSAAGKLLGTLPANTELTLTGINGSICRVEKSGRTAYMYKSDLSDSRVHVETPTEAAEPEPVETLSKTAYVNKDGAKVYSAAGEAIGTLPINTEVTVTAVKGDVCRVEKGGRTAYMMKADLSDARTETEEEPAEEPVQTLSETAYANKDGAKVYDIHGRVIGTLEKDAQVTVTAVKGDVCRVEKGGRTAYMMKADLSARPSGSQSEETTTTTTTTTARGRAVEMDWWTSDIQTIFARGVTATITDVETGLSWQEQRRGGTNHADCQPLTAADTALMKQAYGGAWSWNRRAIIVTINGKHYAASMNGMPHGGGSIEDNNFPGHHCIHFTNSRTHGSNRVCPLHQAAIKRAAAY